jgi:Rap1a immunity proteins
MPAHVPICPFTLLHWGRCQSWFSMRSLHTRKNRIRNRCRRRLCCAREGLFIGSSQRIIDGVQNDRLCIGLIRGLHDPNVAHRLTLQLKKSDVRPLFCDPTEARTEQLIRVIAKYLRDQPARLHEGGVMLALAALADAFPCPAVQR